MNIINYNSINSLKNSKKIKFSYNLHDLKAIYKNAYTYTHIYTYINIEIYKFSHKYYINMYIF